MSRIMGSLTALLAAVPLSAGAATIGLFDYGFNVDGTKTLSGDPTPAGIDLSGFDTGTGLGSVVITVGGAGSHSVLAFFDHEIDESINTFFNEVGSTSGSVAAGQSWEIDEPGFSSVPGDIYDNFLAANLDDSIGKKDPDDVSMALGWNFVLAAGESGVARFFTGLTAPTSGFYLQQTDPDSDASIYFWSSLAICPEDECGQQVSEPGSLLLLVSGLLGLAARRRRVGVARNTH